MKENVSGRNLKPPRLAGFLVSSFQDNGRVGLVMHMATWTYFADNTLKRGGHRFELEVTSHREQIIPNP